MKYIRMYDIAWDEDFQCEADDEVAARAKACGMEVADHPFPKLPIRQRSKADADRERADEYDEVESGGKKYLIKKPPTTGTPPAT